jgi:hypothetical protein
MAMDEKFWPNRKVCDYIFNFMAMSCLLWLVVLWHLSKAIRLFLISCVHYNYKWVANWIVDFQISSSGWSSLKFPFVNISWPLLKLQLMAFRCCQKPIVAKKYLQNSIVIKALKCICQSQKLATTIKVLLKCHFACFLSFFGQVPSLVIDVESCQNPNMCICWNKKPTTITKALLKCCLSTSLFYVKPLFL